MAAANSVGAGNCSEKTNSSEAVLDVIRRKLGKVQANIESNYESVIQRILPGKRKGSAASRPNSLYDSEAVWQPFPEHIEMASMKQRGAGRGHQFLACQLTNPTWCDKCGDFIWGLYKQCQRCNSMEDSGYFSHRSSQFDFTSPSGVSGDRNNSSGNRQGRRSHSSSSSRGLIPSPDDLFQLSFRDLANSSKYAYIRHGFRNSQDFEDFKSELRDFRRLKRETREDLSSSGDDDDIPESARRRGVDGLRSRSSSNSGNEVFTESFKVSEADREVSAAGECGRDGAPGMEDRCDRGTKIAPPVAAAATASGEGGREEVTAAPTGDKDSRGQPPARRCVPRPASDESPVRRPPQVKRSVSLRGEGGGGRRGGVNSKRNGVYFDDDCFLGDCQPRSNSWGASASNSGGEGGEREIWAQRSHSGSLGNPPDLLLFSVPRERKQGRDGARRVSFRETPERFPLPDTSDLPQDVFTSEGGRSSPRTAPQTGSVSSHGSCLLNGTAAAAGLNRSFNTEQTQIKDSVALKKESRPPGESLTSIDKLETSKTRCSPSETRLSSSSLRTESQSPRESLSSISEHEKPKTDHCSTETRSPNGSLTSTEKYSSSRKRYARTVPNSPTNSLNLSYKPIARSLSYDSYAEPKSQVNWCNDGQGSPCVQPHVIPIRLIDVPVSRNSSDLQSSNARNPTSRDRHPRQVPSGDKVSGESGLGIEVNTSTPVSSLPPKEPVSIPIRVDNQKEVCAVSAVSGLCVPGDDEESEGEKGDYQHARTQERRSRKQEAFQSGDKSQDRRSTNCEESRGRGQLGDDQAVSSEQQRRGWANVPKRSSLLENLKRLSGHGRPRSGRGVDPFMEFFSGDEHFQEFERVFDTINNPRFSGSWGRKENGLGRGRDTREEDDNDDDDDDLGVLHIDETFLDFFDNDEDFMEFERELEKIRSSRRSRLFENLNRRSSCDIFADVMSFCDRSLNKNRTPSSSPKVERRLSAAQSADSELWNSAEEWGVVMNKLKRNSRLFADQARLSSGSLCGHGDDFVLNNSSSSSSSTSPQLVRRDVAGHPDRCPCFKDCQYTCHLHCVPSVTLDCTTVSPGSGDGPVATPTDLPSPSASAETSLTNKRTIVSHRSPQKQQQQSTSSPGLGELSARSEPSLLAPSYVGGDSGASGSSSPSQHRSSLSSSSFRDPLSGARVSHTTLTSSSGATPDVLSSSSVVCVERDQNQNAKNVEHGSSLLGARGGDDTCDATNEKDETDSGYRSGTIPDDKLPKGPSDATLNRMQITRKIQTFNHFVPKAAMETLDNGESFQGFLRVTLNLIRPITMELGARPPSIYELLTREHIVEQSTQHIAFYMPRDTVKSIHVTSKTTTKEVITGLLKKFHILDHPRKFAMYEQEFNEKNKLVKLRRLTDKDFPLMSMLTWEPERIRHYRLVLQENETGEIVWDAFSTPELSNFMIVLDREEGEAIAQLRYKYRIMKRIITQRLKEFNQERQNQSESYA